MQLLPACLLSVFVMFWSVPIACSMYRIRFLDLTSKKRDDIFRWAEFLLSTWFGAKVYKVGDQSLYKGTKPVIYLCNHRSWADFFIDKYLTEAEGAPLSRWAVAYVFPVFVSCALWLRHIIFFKRQKVADKEAFNREMEAKFKHTYTNGMIVFPEGHRSTAPDSLPLKRGMLHFAYERGYHIQMIITKGKEQLVSEKRLSAHFGACLACGYGTPIYSSEHKTIEAFVAVLQQEWDRLWTQVYASKFEELPELQLGQDGAAGQEYPMYIKLGQAALCLVHICVFALLMWLLIRIVLSNAVTMTASIGLAAWTAWAMKQAVLQPRRGL